MERLFYRKCGLIWVHFGRVHGLVIDGGFSDRALYGHTGGQFGRRPIALAIVGVFAH